LSDFEKERTHCNTNCSLTVCCVKEYGDDDDDDDDDVSFVFFEVSFSVFIVYFSCLF